MRTPASIAGHPIHPMLITFPVGLFIFSLVCDLFSLGSADPQTWITVAFYTLTGGLIGALAAAVPGAIDLLSIKEMRVKKIALLHMTLNLIAVTLYAVNFWLRYTTGTNHGLPLALSVFAVLLLAVSGWLGGELVHRNAVGVDTERAGEARVVKL